MTEEEYKRLAVLYKKICKFIGKLKRTKKLGFSHLIALALGAQIGELYFYAPIPEPWKSVLIYLTLCAGYFLFKIFDKNEKENVRDGDSY